ncbi:MAG: homoserine O-succinyltransferase [Rhodospirillaceae bacterium]|nr:homoserine O-succinyltransferase [Rhodospirillaceae bacterium]
MPIKIPDDLPAGRTLQEEGVVIISEHDAIRQDIRPLRIAMLNLMPEKIKTETQLARLIGATPLQIEFTLLTTATYTPTHTPREHMIAFYRPWNEIKAEKFDGLIVTGAPVEEMEFEQVKYWPELCEIFDWAAANVFSSFNICWGAQAALYHRHRVPKYLLPRKLSGIFEHRVVRRGTDILRGFADSFPVPVSRYTEVHAADLPAGVTVLAEGAETGLCLVEDRANRATCMFNHLEYDTETLRDEFHRDRLAGRQPALPANYFPDDDPTRPAANVWRPWAHLLFGNWLSEIARMAAAQGGSDQHRALNSRRAGPMR